LTDSLNLLARDSFILNMFAIDKDSERGDTYPQVLAGLAIEENILISTCTLQKASAHVTK
jgi:hypothetical protein